MPSRAQRHRSDVKDTMNGQLTAVVIEDDSDISDLLAALLRQAGYRVHTAMTGNEGVQVVRKHNPDLVTTDLHLPGMDGLEATRQIRAFSDAYIIIISASNDQHDVIMGLEAGADDYIAKPFRPRILRARVEAVQRRPRDKGSEGPPTSGNVLKHDGLELDLRTRVVRVDGREANLTRSEFDVLQCLLSSSRVVRSRAELALLLRGKEPGSAGWVSAADEKTIEVHICNMRRKLGEQIRGARWFETVRGVGYRLTATT